MATDLKRLAKFLVKAKKATYASVNKHKIEPERPSHDELEFEIFTAIKITSKIIFTTAFSDYSIKAFDYNSVSYLLKPINKEKLEEAILKAQKLHQKESDFENFKKLISNYKIENYKESFTVKVGKKIKILKADEITCFYSFENATYLNSDKGNYIINHSLTSLENDLNPTQFFRVNRTFIIQKKTIKDIVVYSNSRLKLDLHFFDNQEIILSRERVKDFKNWID